MLQSDLAFGLAGLFPSGRECDFVFCHRKDTAVGNGDLMGVSSKVFDGISKAVKGFFDVGTPRFLIKTVPEFCPCVGIAQFMAGRWKEQFSLPVVHKRMKHLVFYLCRAYEAEKDIFL